jgi:NitT/TauT family transport system ATP-binding protein
MTAIKVRAHRVSKVFIDESGRKLKALDDVSFEVNDGEFLCILGPSGCGKTTLLRMLAGLDQPTSGELYLKDKPIGKPGPERGMIFQEFALFPWLTVIKNIEFGLEMRGISNEERSKIASRYVEMIGLNGFENSYPHEISGGMNQRVAVARALANEPEVLLMDEPFGTLDAQTRLLMQEELLAIWKATGKTILFVTHCANESVFLAQRVIVMTARPGRINEIVRVDLEHPHKRYGLKVDALKNRLIGLIMEDYEPNSRTMQAPMQIPTMHKQQGQGMKKP